VTKSFEVAGVQVRAVESQTDELLFVGVHGVAQEGVVLKLVLGSDGEIEVQQIDFDIGAQIRLMSHIEGLDALIVDKDGRLRLYRVQYLEA
jgi:hypothetical protein